MRIEFDDLLKLNRKLDQASTLGHKANVSAATIINDSPVSYIKALRPFEYVSMVGRYKVHEQYKEFENDYNIVFDVSDFGEYSSMVLFYLTAVIKKADPGFPYRLTFRFENDLDRMAFSANVSHIREILDLDNLKEVRSEIV